MKIGIIISKRVPLFTRLHGVTFRMTALLRVSLVHSFTVCNGVYLTASTGMLKV
jgi:hypothetical protein